jgi:hypothetical protein
MPVDIDDTEFEYLLEKVFDLWDQKVDTFDMAQRLNVTEAKIHYVFICAMEGLFDCKQQELEGELKCAARSFNPLSPETSGSGGSTADMPDDASATPASEEKLP